MKKFILLLVTFSAAFTLYAQNRDVKLPDAPKQTTIRITTCKTAVSGVLLMLRLEAV